MDNWYVQQIRFTFIIYLFFSKATKLAYICLWNNIRNMYVCFFDDRNNTIKQAKDIK